MFVTSRNSLFRRSLSGLVFRTEDGPRVELRGLTEYDAKEHAGHLKRLSPQDRRLRFHSMMSDNAVALYSRRMDWQHALAFGIFIDGTLRGVGELLVADGSDDGEISVSVEHRFQKAGLGRVLVSALVLAGRRIGLKTAHMYFVPGNERMRALSRAVGAKPTFAGGVVESVIDLEPPADRTPLRSGGGRRGWLKKPAAGSGSGRAPGSKPLNSRHFA
ncbi:GNAT family N-acetyltransferase [uncultured Paracoccus sp.]|uniref:GNAT family N-acetyltransferase n=1 Tax=uncultured Paracoccus sp. TaxID=189685 RepID=UPI0025DE3C55|nr:GNAT family N-acetyltransferase [uncultured Paracoccus sp.]